MKNTKNLNIWKHAALNAEHNMKYTTDSGIFKFFKIIYFIALVYTFAVSLLVLLGQIMSINDYASLAEPTTAQTANVANSKNLAYLIVGSIILYIMSIVLLHKKQAIAFLCVNILPSILLLMSLRLSMADSILTNGPLNYWVRHGIPLIAIIVLSILLFLICFLEKHKIKVEYNRLMNGLYTFFSEQDENIVRNSDFEEYLDAYDGFEVNGNINKPLKRSEKIRKRKQITAENEIVE